MSIRLTRRHALAAAAGVGATVVAAPARAAPVWSVDAFVERVMKAFDVPGLALTVVQDGAITHARGYGVRRKGAAEPVTERTAFALASCTKAFTGAALGMLVEEGRLAWDDPVVKHLPEFAMSDPEVTAEMTVRDLLLHRSGLSLGAGDLMTWPATTFTRPEIVAGLRHLPLIRAFRDGYDYDNVLYIVAGEAIARVSGGSWERFVAERILKPLGMADSAPTADPAWLKTTDYAWPHARLGGALRGLGEQQPLATSGRERTNNGPAGGVRTTARDVGRWLQVQLAAGALPGGARLWSARTANELWRPMTLIRDEAGPSGPFPDRPVMVAYASGWEVRDYRGRKLIWHAGQLNGQSANVVLIPSIGSGFAILSNAEEGNALRALRHTLLDRMLGQADFDWLDNALARSDGQAFGLEREAARLAAHAPSRGPTLPLDAYAGVYADRWYGRVSVERRADGLWVRFERTPRMEGPLEAWDGDTFRTRFPDRNFEDALITFAIAEGRAAGASVAALSSNADFSYDYKDLRLTRVATR